MWPIFQHTLLLSCHINDSWVAGEVCLGFLGFSGFLTNWNSSEVSVEEAFTGGAFLLSLSPLSFSSVCPNTPPRSAAPGHTLPLLHPRTSRFYPSECFHKTKTHEIMGMVDKVNAEVLPVAEQLF